MSYHLHAEEIESFHQRGYHSPISVFSDTEVSELRSELEDFEASQQAQNRARRRTDLHLIKTWAWDVVHDRRIVDPISAVLGPNVLLWSLNWFIKEPHERKFVTYHQDATYWGLEPHHVVTAWIALSDASRLTGPMKFIPGSHLEEVYEHEDTFYKNNLLSRGQEIKRKINESAAVSAPLRAGEMSLHHVRLIHGSEPNKTNDRRIGMVLRYCATNVRQTKLRDTAVLVKGVDQFGNFDLLSAPSVDMGTVELDRQDDALKRQMRAIHSKDYD